MNITLQILMLINQWWQEQARLHHLEATLDFTIKKIEQDSRRTSEDKQRAKNALLEQQTTLNRNITKIKADLFALDDKDGHLKKMFHHDGVDHAEFYQRKYKNFSIDVYRALLPVMQWAEHYEENGDADENACKLACIFEKKEDAMGYLYRFAETHVDSSHIVPEACSFIFPDEALQQAHWLKLAKQKHGENLLNPTFLKLLYSSSDIDNQVIADKKNQKELMASVVSSEEEITQQIKTLKSFCDQYAAGQIPGGRDKENAEINKKNLAALQKLYSQRAILHLKKPVDHYTLQDLHDVYQRVLLKDAIKNYFIEQGIDEAGYQRFLALDRSRAGENIPDIFLDLKNGFYIKKLDVQNDKEAAMAACLGRLSDCCQSISGELGEPCAMHGLTHKDSGFYVLFKGDAQHPDIEKDKVYGQTWVNRTASDALIFDSIETDRIGLVFAVRDTVNAAYLALAKELVKHHSVPRVSCGTASGIVDVMSCCKPSVLESPKDYSGYRDSKKQVLLADASLFMALHTKTPSELDERLFLQELDKCKKRKCITKKMRYNIAFAINNHMSSVLVGMKLRATVSVRKYIELQEQLVDYLNKWQYDSISSKLLQKFLRHNEIDMDVLLGFEPSVLILAAERGDLELVNFLCSKNINLDATGSYGHTALIAAVKENNIACMKVLIDAKANIDVRDGYEQTALMIAQNPKVNAAITELLLAAKADVNLRDEDGRTALHYAIQSVSEQKTALLLAAKADLQVVDAYFSCPLHSAACLDNTVVVSQLISAKADLDEQGRYGHTALMLALIQGRKAVAEVLIAAKARLDLSTDEGETALSLAKERGYLALASLIAICTGQQPLLSVSSVSEYKSTLWKTKNKTPDTVELKSGSDKQAMLGKR